MVLAYMEALEGRAWGAGRASHIGGLQGALQRLHNLLLVRHLTHALGAAA